MVDPVSNNPISPASISPTTDTAASLSKTLTSSLKQFISSIQQGIKDPSLTQDQSYLSTIATQVTNLDTLSKQAKQL